MSLRSSSLVVRRSMCAAFPSACPRCVGVAVSVCGARFDVVTPDDVGRDGSACELGGGGVD
jgi:hypothetical protein